MQKIRRLLAIGVASAMVVCTVPVQAAESAANTAQATTNPAQSATNTPQDTSGTTQPQQPSATVKKIGLVKEGTKYVYYDKKGRKVKNKWLTFTEEIQRGVLRKIKPCPILPLTVRDMRTMI